MGMLTDAKNEDLENIPGIAHLRLGRLCEVVFGERILDFWVEFFEDGVHYCVVGCWRSGSINPIQWNDGYLQDGFSQDESISGNHTSIHSVS